MNSLHVNAEYSPPLLLPLPLFAALKSSAKSLSSDFEEYQTVQRSGACQVRYLTSHGITSSLVYAAI